VHLTGIIKRNFINSLKSLGERMIKIMDKLYLVHGNTWYDGYGYCENLYGVFTDRKTAEKVKTEVTEKLYEKEMHNINTHVESISDIEIDILEVDVNQVTDIELGGYVE